MLEIQLSIAEQNELRNLLNLKPGEPFPSGDAFLNPLKAWRIAYDRQNAKAAGKDDEQAMSLAVEMEANRHPNALVDDAKRRAAEAAGSGSPVADADLALSRESGNPLVENARKLAAAAVH